MYVSAAVFLGAFYDMIFAFESWNLTVYSNCY